MYATATCGNACIPLSLSPFPPAAAAQIVFAANDGFLGCFSPVLIFFRSNSKLQFAVCPDDKDGIGGVRKCWRGR